MSWRAYLCDTMTGQLDTRIDLPSFSWQVDVSDASLATTKSKGYGDTTLSGLTIPWSALPGGTDSARRRAICTDRTSIVLMRHDDYDDPSLPGRPILKGAIGIRTDTALDTSFSLTSTMGLLADRYVVREGKYGTGAHGYSPDVIHLSGLSLRGIASEVGYLCTDCKPGGALPIDWQYRGEKGSHVRDYDAWDIANLSCKDVLTKITNVQGGPDLQFRPYLTTDGNHVREAFVAGSDADIFFGNHTHHYLNYGPNGGMAENLTVDHLGPMQRVYATGAGQDKTTLTYLAEDLSRLRTRDPWILHETTYNDNDQKKLDLLKQHANHQLDANRNALMQLSCTINADEHDATGAPKLQLGTFWPGESFTFDIDGYPPLPDGRYETRLMQMSGDQTSQVKLVFDVMDDPIY